MTILDAIQARQAALARGETPPPLPKNFGTMPGIDTVARDLAVDALWQTAATDIDTIRQIADVDGDGTIGGKDRAIILAAANIVKRGEEQLANDLSTPGREAAATKYHTVTAVLRS